MSDFLAAGVGDTGPRQRPLHLTMCRLLQSVAAYKEFYKIFTERINIVITHNLISDVCEVIRAKANDGPPAAARNPRL